MKGSGTQGFSWRWVAPLLFAFVLMPYSQAQSAADEQTQKAWTTLIAWGEGVTSAEGAFRQIERRSDGRRRELAGSFAFVKPLRFRWTIERPFVQVTVSDGTTLTVWDPELRQATVQPLDPAALRAGPLAFFLAPETLPEQFTLERFTQADGVLRWSLRARTDDAVVRRVEITIAETRLRALTIEDALGQTSELLFTRFERTMPQPGAFQLTLPPDAVVLRTPQRPAATETPR